MGNSINIIPIQHNIFNLLLMTYWHKGETLQQVNGILQTPLNKSKHNFLLIINELAITTIYLQLFVFYFYSIH
jgi:hypothetical protein